MIDPTMFDESVLLQNVFIESKPTPLLTQRYSMTKNHSLFSNENSLAAHIKLQDGRRIWFLFDDRKDFKKHIQ